MTDKKSSDDGFPHQLNFHLFPSGSGRHRTWPPRAWARGQRRVARWPARYIPAVITSEPEVQGFALQMERKMAAIAERQARAAEPGRGRSRPGATIPQPAVRSGQSSAKEASPRPFES
jgi:hypothetical protein